MGNRKVSVIIPTYNRARYLRESLESALGQTYRNLEIIVVDDGSTDNTQDMLAPYIESGRIMYLYQSNSGRPSIARNHALQHASGDYICFLDSDDIRREESIAREVDILDRHDEVGMVCTDWLFFKRQFNPRLPMEDSWIKKERYIETLPHELVRQQRDDVIIFEKDFIYELFNTNFVFTSSVITSRELLDQVGHFDESLTIGEDCDLWLRIGEVKHIAFITTPLVYRRMHSGSITNSLARNIIDDTRVIEKFLSRGRAITPSMKRRFYQRLENFYSQSAVFFFYKENLAEARKRFLRALRYNPSCYRYYRYFFLSLFPLRALEYMRKLKGRIKRTEVGTYS